MPEKGIVAGSWPLSQGYRHKGGGTFLLRAAEVMAFIESTIPQQGKVWANWGAGRPQKSKSPGVAGA